MRSTLMRVALPFKEKIETLARKDNTPTITKWTEGPGLRLLSRAEEVRDAYTNFFPSIFGRKRNKKK